MSGKKKIILGILIALFLSAILWLIFYSPNEEVIEVAPVGSIDSPAVSLVQISNADMYLDTTDTGGIYQITSSVYGLLVVNGLADDKKSVTATIRDGSYVRSDNPDDESYESTFLIDFPELKQSYRVHFGGPSTVNTLSPAYTDCPLASETLYTEFDCIAR